ncbi:site-2 protease family protein [Candidatus Saccharibacteria bacterium]|nr:site-2 protease family protein [Candidatus Saccharibacteria bacterium]
MLIILGVVLLISLVIVHELGHFWAARRAGIAVEEFGLGFPPRAKVLTEKNGTKYTLNWLPLGGFVKLKGEHDSDTTKGSFGAASLTHKVQVMVAGVIMNVLAAIVLLSIIAAVGIPKVLPGQFSVPSDTKVIQHDVVIAVQPGSPADKAGLKGGDKILSIYDKTCGGQCIDKIEASEDLKPITKKLAGKEVVVVYNEAGKEYQDDYEHSYASVTLLSEEEVQASKNTDEPKGYLGVIPSDYIKQRSTWSAPLVGAATTGQFFWETLKGLGGIIADLFQGQGSQAKEQVTGVVGIGYVLNELAKQGFMSVLFLTAIISVSLAVMNILPIPALDGGRLFVTLLFRLLRKPLNKDVEERIHGTGFALLMMLFLLITVFDVQRFIIN